jgi:menaquinone-specific isochorismate synthase
MPTFSDTVLEIGTRPDFGELLRGDRISFDGGVRRHEWILDDAGLFTPRWLEAAPAYPRFFWRSRSGAAQTLAMGSVAEGTLPELLELLERSGRGVRVFGGACFDRGDGREQCWEGFPAECFFIPKAEIVHSGGRTRLAVNLGAGGFDLEDVAVWVAGLGECVSGVRPRVLTRWNQPNFSQWSAGVDSALAAFQEGGISKVVLARRSCLELAEAVTPFALAGILAAAAPGCFHYCIEPEAKCGAFLGASPELLYRREGLKLRSEAVAGTRPRSLDASEDERLESQLLEFSKEQLEHRLVVDSLGEVFSRLCTDFSGDEKPGVLKLSRVQHLRTGFAGRLREGISDGEILAAFHPTPATCGCPTAAAMDFLKRNEPFDRGWYAGPVGCVAREEAEFAAAIRSMWCRGAQVDVFAGAGIVEGSDAEREWSELEDKISGVLHLLSA